MPSMPLMPFFFKKNDIMRNYRYTLEPYNGRNNRYYCPECKNLQQTFTRYIDLETGRHVNPIVGRCSREIKCGYHYTPKQYFQFMNIPFENTINKVNTITTTLEEPKPISHIQPYILKASIKKCKQNYFIDYLISQFGIEETNKLIDKYLIGTAKYWEGATVFWQKDIDGNIRSGKIMLYNPTSGKRIKEPFNHINWVHKVLKLDNFNLKQCLFGEHLLQDKTKPIAIVESEKTAIISSVYVPDYIWLASGSLSNLNTEKCKVLKGRIVTLFPDIKGFDKWNAKALELSHIATFNISDLLERKATQEEREKGLDLADYMIRFNHREFISSATRQTKI